MTAKQATAMMTPTATATALHLHTVEGYARRRKWSRTDSARHLNERSESLLARYRRAYPAQRVLHSDQFGYWLKDRATALFDRAHEKLLACKDDEARARLLPSDLL